MTVPEGIAIDVDGGKVYWTDSENVGRANLDGSQIETIGTIEGSDLALDVGQGKMYVASWPGIIYRTSLGGSPIETIVPESGAPDAAIALDLSRGKMFWGGWRREEIKRANLDGSQIEIIVTGTGRVYDLDVDESGGKLYWASGAGILRANLDGSQVETLFTGSTQGVALDLGGGKIYWTEWGFGSVKRANLDGSQVENLSAKTDFLRDIALGP